MNKQINNSSEKATKPAISSPEKATKPAISSSSRVTKHERRRERREEQHRREVEQKRNRRVRRIAAISVIAAVIVTVVVYVIAINFIIPPSKPLSASVAGTATAQAIQSSSLAAVVDNVPCNSGENLTYHVHSHISIYVNGSAVALPANIGITNTCFYWLHTHDTSGVIHIEAPGQQSFALGSFLHLWVQQFSQLQFPSQLNQVSGWTAYVNGKLYTGDFNSIPLGSHTLITLAYQSPNITPDTTYNWGSL